MSAAALACLALLAARARAGSPADVIQGLLDQAKPIEAMFSIEVPHPELRVKLEGFLLTPALGVRSVFDFVPEEQGVEARGELCLLAEEVAPLTKAAREAGFDVEPARARYRGESPKLLFMRLDARGSRDAMTDAARRLLDALRERRVAAGLQPGPTNLRGDLDAGKLERAFGSRPKAQDGVLRFERGRDDWAAVSGTMERALVVGVVPAAKGRAEALAAAGFELPAPAAGALAFQALGRPAELGAALRGVLKKEAPGR